LYKAPGALTNPLRDQNLEFAKQKTYLAWEPTKKAFDSSFSYDKVTAYDITKEA
jgi:hypothetical protein